jgi:hypothetical protein
MKAILSALQVFHKEVKPVKRSADNPFFKSKYASLEDIQSQIREPLSKAGLVVTQANEFNEHGTFVSTKVWHVESGDCLTSVFPVIAKNQTAQEYGSAVSYAKRYSLTGLLNLIIVDEDDDGAKASGTIKQITTNSLTALQYDAMVKFISEGKIKEVEAGLKKYTLTPEQTKLLTAMINQKKAELIKASTI